MASLVTSPPNVYPSSDLIPNTVRLMVAGFVYEDPKWSRDHREVQPVGYSRRYQDLITEVSIAWPAGSSSIDMLTYEAFPPRVFLVSSVEGLRAYLVELKVEGGASSGERTYRWTVYPRP